MNNDSQQEYFRLVDYLVLVTEAFGECLFLLAGLFGEERALRLIEEGIEREQNLPLPLEVIQCFKDPKQYSSDSANDPYQELQLKIDRMRRHPQMEFYVWSYSGYRVWAESAVDLDSYWIPQNRKEVERIEKDALMRFQLWYKNLKIPEIIDQSTLEVLNKPWKKFSVELYKASGFTPFKIVQENENDV